MFSQELVEYNTACDGVKVIFARIRSILRQATDDTAGPQEMRPASAGEIWRIGPIQLYFIFVIGE
jgi:hypothetical protein